VKPAFTAISTFSSSSPRSPIGEEAYRLRGTLDSLRLAADIVVISREDAERRRDVYGTVVHAAFSEGKVIAA
jgi:hypothetical protein